MSEKTKLIGKNGCKKMKLTVTRKITASILTSATHTI